MQTRSIVDFNAIRSYRDKIGWTLISSWWNNFQGIIVLQTSSNELMELIKRNKSSSNLSNFEDILTSMKLMYRKYKILVNGLFFFLCHCILIIITIRRTWHVSKMLIKNTWQQQNKNYFILRLSKLFKIDM